MSIEDFLQSLDFEDFKKWRKNRNQQSSGRSEQPAGTGVSDIEKELTQSLNRLDIGNVPDATQPETTSSTPLSPSGTSNLHRLSSGHEGDTRVPDDKEYFELIKEYAIAKARAANSAAASIAVAPVASNPKTDPKKKKVSTKKKSGQAVRTFNNVLASFLPDKDEQTNHRNQGKMRRCLLYNVGSIQTVKSKKWTNPFIKKEVIELIMKIKPDVALFNELCLKYSDYDDATRNALHEKVGAKLHELTEKSYVLKSIVPSFKTANTSGYPWKCGSAVIIRKDRESKFEKLRVTHKNTDGTVESFDGGHHGEKFDFDSAIVRDTQLNVPIICLYIRGHTHHSYHDKAAQRLSEIDGGIGGGDLNMKDGKFEEHFSSSRDGYCKMKDCSNDTYFTHQGVNGGKLTYSRIDYIFLDERVKHLSVIVHKPLLPDQGVGETHYPIIFDIFRVEEGSEPTATWCKDPDCQFKCTEREGGLDEELIERRKNEEQRESSILRGENVPKKRGRPRKSK